MAAGNSSGVPLYPDLSAAERAALQRDECPDCGRRDRWQAGPHGGACVTFRCGICGSRFSLGSGVFFERISQPRPGLLADWIDEGTRWTPCVGVPKGEAS